MIIREFKVNCKSFIIWLAVLIVMFLVVYLIYPYIITDETMKSIDEMMTIFPEEVLKAFNMDIASISTAYGWLKTEGFTFVLLIVGMYSAILGGNILLKEESDKTIEYLGVLPVTRNRIVFSKTIVGIINIILMVVLLGIFNYIALMISGSFDHQEFILLSITPILIGLPIFAINLYVSTFFHKTKKTIGVSLGMVFIFYIFSVLSELSTKVDFMKYFSVYTLADTRNVLANISINPWMVIISILLSMLFISLAFIRYNKKEFT